MALASTAPLPPSTVAFSALVITSAGDLAAWSAAPRLANIADTGGTNRITTATSSPQVSITGDLDVSNDVALGATASITANRTVVIAADKGTGSGFRCLSVIPTKSVAESGDFAAMQFLADITATTGTQAVAYGCIGLTRNTSTATLTSGIGLTGRADNTSTGTITGGDGIFIFNAVNSGGGTFTEYRGVRVQALTTADTNYAIATLGGQTYHAGNVRIGSTAAPTVTLDVVGQTYLDQSSTTAAVPTLTVDQADISEGTINFVASARGVITGATNSTDSVRVELNGTVYRLALYVDA